MIVVPGYELESIVDRGASAHVYRGRRTCDSAPLIFKVPRVDTHDPAGTRARVSNEHAILTSLTARGVPGVVRCVALESYQGLPVLVLEDAGLRSLRETLDGEPMALAPFLALALGLTEILGRVHEAGVIHKDVNPSNVLWCPESRRVQLIDFGTATQTALGAGDTDAHALLAGTLAYLSPEQTGRMNRAVDYRTDFYALGMTFYELLTGSHAFSARDAMELLHCHIAKTPLAPSEIVPGLPPIVSDIVMKLVAKMAEDRYQSAHGLATDLRRLQGQLERGEPLGGFVLAERDVSQTFRLPQKLYGREEQTEELSSIFERVAAGKVELVTVRGYTGIGKTLLVTELRRPLVKRGAYFAVGKSDRSGTRAPFGVAADACRQLCRDILLESPERLAEWRRILAEQPRVRHLARLVPEIAVLLGDEAPPPTDAADGHADTVDALATFLETFGKLGRPLVFFLDDLHVADSGTLDLLEAITTRGRASGLLVVGAYRDNEVDASHPLTSLLDRIAQSSASRPTSIVLAPLALSDVDQIAADTLSRSRQDVLPLGALLHEKSGGSPFFLGELLVSLHASGLLSFAHDTGRWDWNLAGIEAVELTSNVVGLMVDRIRRMEEQSQRTLRVAACIGRRFELGLVAAAQGRPPRQTVTDLWESLQEGFILTLDDANDSPNRSSGGRERWFQFNHEHLRQAAYAMSSRNERAALHLSIGRYLAKALAEGPHSNALEVLHHFIAGEELLVDPAECDEVAALALATGRSARTSAAHESASSVLAFGTSLLSDDAWERSYTLAYDLHLERARAQFLLGDVETAAALFTEVAGHARSLPDAANAHRVEIALLETFGRYAEAVSLGRAALGFFGMSLPHAPSNADVDSLVDEVASLLGGSTDALLGLSPMTAPEAIALSETLITIAAPAYYVDPNLAAVVSLRALLLALGSGRPASLALVASSAAFALAPRHHEKLAADLGRLGWKLAVEDTRLLGRATGQLGDWRRHEPDAHLRASRDRLRKAFRLSRDAGDAAGAADSAARLVATSFALGAPLTEARAEAAELLAYASGVGSVEMAAVLRSVERASMLLVGLTNDPTTYSGPDGFDEVAFEHSMNGRSPYAKASHAHHRAFVHYLFGDFAKALRAIAEVSSSIDALRGDLLHEEHLFHDALIRLAVFDDVEVSGRDELLGRARENEAELARLATRSRASYEHQRLLVAAEIARVTGRKGDAAELYDLAIEAALEGDWVGAAAVACECALRFHIGNGRIARARGYAIEAHAQYMVWGASAKVTHLAEQYRALLPSARSAATSAGTGSVHGTAYTISSANGLDLSTLTKATQVISSEIRLDRLLQTLTRISIENAGAERGFIVLERGGRLFVEAAGGQQSDGVARISSTALETCAELSVGIVSYVARTRTPVVLDDASASQAFAADPYVAEHGTKSLLCLPITSQSRLVGVIYLENNLSVGCFDIDRLEAVRILLGQIAISIENATLYASLEEKVRERTHALQLRERAMQLVLDSTGDGLLSVGRDGVLHDQPSRAAIEWFGPVRPETKLWDYVSSGDAAFDFGFSFAFEQLVDDLLPFEMARDQMPRRITRGDRTFDLEYRQVFEDGAFAHVLVVVRDISLAVEAQRAESDALEKQHIIGRLLSDRDGVQRFLADTTQLLAQLGSVNDDVVAKRLLHTVKGNAAVFGFDGLATHCHAIETRLAESEEPRITADDVTALEARFAARIESIRDFLRANDDGALHVREDDLAAVIEGVKTGRDQRELLELLESWRFHPAADYLETLGEQTSRLAERLGKQVEITAEDNAVRIAPATLDPFLSSLVHVVRNAIDHGIESVEERAARGKPAAGNVRLTTRLTKEHLVFEIADDGRGIDLDALARAAERRGIPFRGAEDAVDVLFADGVSTRDEVTETSGRGVGLGAVRDACTKLGGHVSVTWEQGRRTVFTFELPPTYARAPRRELRVSGKQLARKPLLAAS